MISFLVLLRSDQSGEDIDWSGETKEERGMRGSLSTG